MRNTARGTFDVQLVPQPPSDKAGEANVGRLSIDKIFHGDLEAVSRGEMLSYRTAEEGSAGYVAIERVTGLLHGCAGSFVLQHGGIMDRGSGRTTIVVIPDSGTGELSGISGGLTIMIENGRHYYEFAYAIPDTV